MNGNWIPLTETGPRVTDEDVRHFERTIDHERPPDYRAFLLDVNGGDAPNSHCVFRLRKDTTVARTEIEPIHVAAETDRGEFVP